MSKAMQKDEESQPDFSKFYRPHQADTEKTMLARPLITSDKDNPTKTRIPNGYVMSVVDSIDVWTEIEHPAPYRCPHPDCKLTFYDPEAYMDHRWGEVYRVDMISEGGESRDEFVDVASAPWSLGFKEKDEARMKEGSRK